MTVPQAEIDTFHLRTSFRRILPLGRRRLKDHNIWSVNGENDRTLNLKLTLFTYVRVFAELPPSVAGDLHIVCESVKWRSRNLKLTLPLGRDALEYQVDLRCQVF